MKDVSALVQQTAVGAERAGSAVATGSGVWLWLAENHSAIAAVCGIGGLLIACIGLAVNWWYLHNKHRAV